MYHVHGSKDSILLRWQFSPKLIDGLNTISIKLSVDFFFFLQQAEMSKAMQRTLFVNKSQTTLQDSNDHKRYISSPLHQYIKSLFYDYSRKYY